LIGITFKRFIASLVVVVLFFGWGGAPLVAADPVPEVLSRCRERAVEVLAYFRDHDGRMQRVQGSGFCLSRRGLVVTNAHVVNNAEAVFVVTERRSVMRCQIYKLSSVFDLAILKIKGSQSVSGTPVAELHPQRFSNGMKLFSVHYQSDHKLQVTFGRLLRRREISPHFHLLELDMHLISGNSGSAVCSMKGELAGIIVGNHSAKGFAIPIQEIDILVDDLEYLFFRQVLQDKGASVFSLPSDDFLPDEEEWLSRAYQAYLEQNYVKALDALAKVKKHHAGRPDLAIFSAALLARQGMASMAIDQLVPWTHSQTWAYVDFWTAKIYDEFLHQPAQAGQFYQQAASRISDPSLRAMVNQRLQILQSAAINR